MTPNQFCEHVPNPSNYKWMCTIFVQTQEWRGKFIPLWQSLCTSITSQNLSEHTITGIYIIKRDAWSSKITAKPKKSSSFHLENLNNDKNYLTSYISQASFCYHFNSPRNLSFLLGTFMAWLLSLLDEVPQLLYLP